MSIFRITYDRERTPSEATTHDWLPIIGPTATSLYRLANSMLCARHADTMDLEYDTVRTMLGMDNRSAGRLASICLASRDRGFWTYRATDDWRILLIPRPGQLPAPPYVKVRSLPVAVLEELDRLRKCTP